MGWLARVGWLVGRLAGWLVPWCIAGFVVARGLMVTASG